MDATEERAPAWREKKANDKATETSRGLRRRLEAEIERRGQAEKSLDECERRWALVANNVEDAVWTADMDLHLTYASTAAERLRGYEVPETLSQSIAEMLTPASLEHAMRVFSEQSAIEESGEGDPARCWTLELEAVRRDGTTIWVEERVTFMRDSEGRPVGLLGVTRDITRLKQAEEALRERERLYRLVTESVSDLIWITDLNLKPTYVSPSVTRILGYTVEEAKAVPLAEYMPESSLVLALEAFETEKALEGSGGEDAFRSGVRELEMTRKDGSTIWTEVRANMIRDAGGRLVGVLGVTRDISERKRSEQALQERERWFKNIYLKSPIGIELYDADGHLTDMNKACLEIFGLSDVSQASVSLPLFADPIIPDEAKELLRLGHSLSYEGPFDFDRARKAGHYAGARSGVVELNLVVTPLGPAGRNASSGYLLQIQDVTKRKQAEKALQDLYMEESKLRRELETQMNRRIEFTRTLVHELKTPLTSVMASSELMVAGLEEGPMLSLAKNLSRSASSLNSRIDELLDVARLELGMLHLDCRPIDPRQLLRRVADDMSAAARGHGQTLTVEMPALLSTVSADEVRLQQVVFNLLGNAVKWTREGGRIVLRAREEADSLVVEVEDTGIGIDEEEQSRLFDAYYRVESDRDRVSGLGLGLALSKKLVELHGGRIWVKSQKGKGSTFGFSVPLNDTDVKDV